MTKRILAGALAALVVAGGACASGRETPSPTPAAAEPVATGTPASTVAPPAAPAASPRSLFVLRLVDQNGARPSGIPVRIEGARNETVLTDGNGEVRLETPGTYRAAVAVGCHDAIEVMRGDSGRLGLAVGERAEAQLQVWWRHRFAPGRPVFTDTSGGWPVGRVVGVRFDVVDRCGGRPAPNAGYPTYVFTTAANLVVAEPPTLVADAEGHGWVRVRCQDVGETELVVRDERNASDVLDLLAAALDLGGRPRCVAA